jgi:uncharacterized protein YjbI with pentapeptide repeats
LSPSWGWTKLLVVPAAIAAVGLWFNRQQQERALEVERQRAQDEALQAYFDQMGQLLLGKDPPLRQSEEDSEVRTLARARTLTVLSRLDGRRKGQVVQFLYEAGLISSVSPVLDLSDADLRWAFLVGAGLSGADLTGADLNWAVLTQADVTEEQLEEALTLEFATMPNGQKYEDWLKDKSDSKENE